MTVSGVTFGELDALFPAATKESGRALVPVEPLEPGRCCQERVPARDSDATEVDGGGVAAAVKVFNDEPCMLLRIVDVPSGSAPLLTMAFPVFTGVLVADAEFMSESIDRGGILYT